MLNGDKYTLSNVRLERAQECLVATRALFDTSDYKSAMNRAYYAIFNAMRSILAFDEIDMKHHSGIISEFRRLYIKTGNLPVELSVTISELYNIRTNSDYDDFFFITKEKAHECIELAAEFLNQITHFLGEKHK